MEKIAVTGATGFVGRHLIRRLLSEGHAVRVLTRHIPRARTLFSESVECVEGDLSCEASLKRFLSGAGLVFHLASELKDKTRMQRTNVEGTKNLLDAVAEIRPRKYIHLSSAGVTGQGAHLLIDEETPCHPGNEYEKTKLEAEQYARAFGEDSGVSVSILRPTNVVGEDKDNLNDSFYQLLRQINHNRFFYLGHGQGVSNYVYVKDVVNALIALADAPGPGGQTFIINDRASMADIVEYVKACCHITRRTINLSYRPVLWMSAVISACAPHFVLTPSRVKALYSPYAYSSDKLVTQLGYTFVYGIREGIRRTIRWLNGKGCL